MVNVADLTIRSRSFEPDHPIPREHAAEGVNARPIFEISGVTTGTAELALLCHDPDAPMPNGFTHWVVYGLPPNTGEVGEQEVGREGPNSLGETGYTGPNPPSGTACTATTFGSTRSIPELTARRPGKSS